MPEVLTLSPPASTGPELALQSVAIRSVGLGHRRTAPPNSRKQEVVDSSRRLPHQVDRSRASILHHRARHKKLRMEEHHYEIWDPANSHLGQRDAVRFQLLQELLPGAWHLKCLLHPGVPIEQRPG
ncbi:hypothetical protein AAC387_Pa02g2291 [Persea americana]